MKPEPHSVLGQPSPWVVRWAHLIPAGGTVLDCACGSGRHLRWLAERNFKVTGVDRDSNSLRLLSELGRVIEADIENGPWPLAGERFDAVVVTNYLWRPLMPTLVGSLNPGGVFVYETFAQGQETVGRPARPDFLLKPLELLQTCDGLDVVAYENGCLEEPARFVQRIVAVRPRPDLSAWPPRYPLNTSTGPGG